MDLLAAKTAEETPKINPNPPDDSDLLAAPPELKPLSREPINLKMTNDSRTVFETIAKLAGLSVIFDPDFTSRRISVDLPNITLEEALDAVSFESKAFWQPMTSNVILIAPDNPQKRRDIEDEEVKTFYLSNTLTPQDLTEVVSSLRQLLDLRRISQMNSQNAIVVRDTPDKIKLAAKIIDDIDKARPEVLIHVQVLTASINRLRDLGLLPGQSITLAFNPTCANQPSSSTSSCGSTTTSSTTPAQLALNNIKNLSTADYSLTLPGATANAILTDNQTRIIQDPELRMSDGQKTTLKVGERVPIATGSFQAGVGVGAAGGAGVVNPLVNTQFTYIDVGVNIEVTPHVHPDGDVSIHGSVTVSEIDGTSSIGGINQPIIGQRNIENDVRLKNGESSMLAGLIQRTDTKNINGIPGLAQLPMLRYLFSDNSTSVAESEVLIIMTPHVIRFPSISAENLRTLAAGTDSNARVYPDSEFTQAPAGTERGLALAFDFASDAAARSSGSESASVRAIGRHAAGGPAHDFGAGRFERQRPVFDPAADSFRPGGCAGGGSSRWRIPLGRQAGDRDRAADRPAARPGDRIGHTPAEYAGRERVGHAARARGQGGGAGQNRTPNPSGECAQFASANHTDGFRRGDHRGAVERTKMAKIHRRAKHSWMAQQHANDAGMTLLELIISCSILVILATVALPLERVRVISAKEEVLHYDLREMRDAIDRYHDDAEKGKFQVQAGTENYPPDLETLKDGVQMSAQGTGILGGALGGTATSDQSGTSQRVRYLREIPVDPMTGNTDWGLRSVQDDADSTSWGGQDVFDVYSKSQGTALDGTKYSDW